MLLKWLRRPGVEKAADCFIIATLAAGIIGGTAGLTGTDWWSYYWVTQVAFCLLWLCYALLILDKEE